MSTNKTRKNWSRDELIVAFNLYCTIPFTKINASNKVIKAMASVIGRSNSALALKLANYARLDPALKERNISGMTHGSKAEEEIWNEFHGNWEELAWESESALANMKEIPIELSANIITQGLHIEGKETSTVIKQRVNQAFFRKTILASYNNQCCITGISIPSLLIASHIIPWSKNKEHRMNPANGLCLNSLHDKAFDQGLITVTPDFYLKFSDEILSNKNSHFSKFFRPLEKLKIALPQKFYPAQEFLEYHNIHVFKG